MYPRHFAEFTPDHPAIIAAESGEVTSYRALEENANQGAHLVQSLGLRPGDTIALYMANVPEYFSIYWAAQRSGLYIVPISSRLTAGEVAYIVGDSDAKILVASPDLEASRTLIQNRGDMRGLRHLFVASDRDCCEQTWQNARNAMPITPIPDEIAGIHMPYSSGTTGRPTGIRLPFRGGAIDAPHQFAEFLRDAYGASSQTVSLCPLPLYHNHGLVWNYCLQRLGGTVVLMKKFDPIRFLDAVQHYHATFITAVPTMFTRLLKLPEGVRRSYNLSSLKTILHAAAPCPILIKRQMIEWLGPIIDDIYGGSEVSGATTITSEEWLRKPGSVGRPHGCTIHICDESGAELTSGKLGLIYFGGGVLYKHHNNPTKTKEAIHPLRPDLSTLGDIGFVDEDGYLFLADRRDFMIISAGINIYPQEIENELILHPAVADVAVFGVPNELLGEEVKAVVQPVEGVSIGTALEGELMQWLRGRIASYKCPISIDFEQQLPRSDSGKLFKRVLRDRYLAGVRFS